MKKNFTYISLFLFVIIGLTALMSWSYAELTDVKDNNPKVKVVTKKDGTTRFCDSEGCGFKQAVNS